MALLPEFFTGLERVQWDGGNSDKNWRRHRVTQSEAEQACLSRPLVVKLDPGHSGREVRHFLLGRTDAGRALMIVFTLRGDRIRVISARPMSRRERRVYAEARRA